jgi:glycolate oxidase iron-sulfur subunit
MPTGSGLNITETSPVVPTADHLLALADQCVKCGYCLPVCPTFHLHHSEAESPRGRIALIQGWLAEELACSPVLFQHLDQCLECRACEVVCPSLVRFGSLMDGARALRQARRPWWQRWLYHARLTLLSQPRWLSRFAPLARALRLVFPGTVAADSNWPFLHMAMRLSASVHTPRQPMPAALPARSAADTAPIGFFLGCSARATQGETIDAARRLFAHLEIPWREPDNQGCCGALHQHHGFAQAARQRRVRNRHAFRDHSRVVGFASACVLELQGAGDMEAVEICDFLIASQALARVQPHPLPARVLVHEPCSHRLLPGGTAAIYQLLARIPQLEIQPLPGNQQCCGAAGSYLLEQPRVALALLEPKIAALRTLSADYLVTTNSGCALHLAAGVRAAGLKIQVRHPIELLERQLGPPGISTQSSP